VVFVNILKSGLSSSLGGGGRGGTLVDLIRGKLLSESVTANTAGGGGVDVTLCIESKGSCVILQELASKDSCDSYDMPPMTLLPIVLLDQCLE
jgi:hypothetical protein